MHPRSVPVPVRAALLVFVSAGCGQNTTADHPPRAPVTAHPPRVAEPARASSSASPAVATPSPPSTDGTPEPTVEPALFVRLGDTLMPLGCRAARGWAAGEKCATRESAERVTVYPSLLGESDVRSATRASIPFTGSGTMEHGLLLVETERDSEQETGRPLLGFAIAGSAGPIRFAEPVARRMEEEAAAWCKQSSGACRGAAAARAGELARRKYRVEEELVMVELVRQASSALAEQPPVEVTGAFAISVAGTEQRILDVELDTSQATGTKAAALQLPTSLHYLIVDTANGLRRLNVVSDFDFGLGEAGELVGAVDLDRDGTDELILEWHYSEGRSWQLARRVGHRLVVIGSFTDGT